MTQPSCLQFSIRLMLAVTAAVAAAVAAIRAETTAEAILAIDSLSVFFATAAILGAMHSGGKLRSFWIGTAAVIVPVAFSAVESAWSILPYLGQRPIGQLTGWLGPRQVWLLWCAAPVNGLAAVFLHWLFWPRPPESGP